MHDLIESSFASRGYRAIAGCDEAGRGPLAGPVVAAAVILGADIPEGVDDSKQLTEKQREALFPRIIASARAYAIVAVGPREIDRRNILEASRLAMQRAVKKLSLAPDLILTDALPLNITETPQLALIHGDARSASIAAASILAKVYRDALMRKAAKAHPLYGFDRHFGYPTPAHYRALREHGPCSIHRQSFRLA